MTIALTEHELQFALRHLDQLNPAQKTQVLQLLEERDTLAKYEDARQHFLSFVKMVWPDFIPGAHHQIMAEAFEDVAAGKCNRLIINLPPRHCLALDTPLLTPTGWTTMGEIRPGDYVYGADGKPTQVVGKSEVHVGRTCYRVTAKDGTSIVTDGGHLWRAAVDRKRPGVFKLRTTEQLFQREQGTAEHRKAWIPDSPPVVFEPGAPLPVGPYTLGMWIGNGHASQAIITNDSRDLAPVRAIIESEGYTTTDQATRLTFGILGLKVKLRDLGVLDNKHIPDAYMRASVEDRLRLLYGLFDSDGCCSREGQCDISTSDPRLRDQYEELLRSVGIHPHVYELEAKIGDKSYGPAWRLYFYAEDFGLAPRKRSRTRANTKPVRRYISVAEHESVPVQCIEVDRPDGLFLAGRGLLVTHNTKSELASWLLPAWFLGKFPRKKIIQASNTEALAAGFGRRVRNLIDGEDMSDGSDDATRNGFSAYQSIFPNVRLAADSKAAAGWHTNKGGEYFAIGVNGKVTGKGGDIVIIDDPHALEISTPIPTPKGFVAISDLQIGDEVFGPDGKPTKVIAKSDVMRDRELFAVETDDRQVVLCDGGHLWTYRSDTKLSAPMRTATARELAVWGKVSKPYLPRHNPVEYPEANLPVDPWVFGAWLGDGTSSLGRMTAHPDDAPYMRQEFEKAGYVTTDIADEFSFGVRKLRAQLISMGVLNNKHIPSAYLLGSVAQRMALLQGLMDTDGNITEAGQCAFHNANRGLVEGVIQLLHSLGVKAKLSTYPDKRANHQTRYRVTFKLKDAARMPRKAVRSFTPTDKRSRSVTVTPVGETGSVQCITVDRPDGLFLAGYGYVVTHNSEQEAKQAESNPAIFDDVYAWYNSGPRQRLQPGGTIILVMTRWSKRDLTGKVLAKQAAEKDNPDTDKWRVISFPALLDENTPEERPTWPGFWPLPTLRATRSVLPVSSWSAQYQQNPTSEGAAILKREYWRRWGDDDKEKCPGPQHIAAWQNGDPPACEYIIGSWDCAATANERSHPSAYTLWGVFKAEDPTSGKTLNHIILLQAYKARMEFPELKRTAKQFYDEDRPDTLLIENKSAGMQLLQEFRSMGIPAEGFTGSSRGSRALSNDKIARANMIADVFASRYVWCPPTRFADEVMEQCASFPAGEEDDLVDSTVQAMLRFREGGFVRTANDEAEDSAPPRFRRKRYY